MQKSNVLALIQQELEARVELGKAQKTYLSVRKPMEDGIKVFVITFYDLFRPLVLRSIKHQYDIPEVRKHELDDVERIDILHDFDRFSLSTIEDDFYCFSGHTKPTYHDQCTVEWVISIPSKYLGEGGASFMQQDAERIKADLDALDASDAARQAQEQEAADLAKYKELKRRFGQP